MNGLLGLLFAVAVIWLASAVIIWIVGKLGLRLELTGFGSALVAALIIAALTIGVFYWLGGLLLGSAL